MPSGAKKRKAIKKKQQQQQQQTTSLNHHRDNDLRVHDEKESDGGDTNSPLSQDNHNNQHFADGEDKREDDTSSIQSAVTESESVEGVNGNGESSDTVAVEGKSGIQIDREIKLEDDSESKTVPVEHNEIEKKSSCSSSSRSSSSSDDESKFVDKNIEVINWEEPIEYATDLPAQAAAVVDVGKTSDLPEVTQVNEVVTNNLAMATLNEEYYEKVSAEGPSTISVKPVDFPETIAVAEAATVVDDHDHDFAAAKSEVEASDLVTKTIPQVEPVILSKEEVHLAEDLGSKISGKSESSGVTSIEIVEDNEAKNLAQSSIPAVDAVYGIEHKNNSEIESLDKQTPVARPPRPVQTTSSMGCCGLFELFTGSKK